MMQKYRLGRRQHGLLVLAVCRYTQFGNGEPLHEAQTGLGTMTEYKPVLQAGYMERADTYKECRGALRLFRLTDKGAAIVQQWLNQGYNYEKFMRGGWPPASGEINVL